MQYLIPILVLLLGGKDIKIKTITHAILKSHVLWFLQYIKAIKEQKYIKNESFEIGTCLFITIRRFIERSDDWRDFIYLVLIQVPLKDISPAVLLGSS